MKQECQAIDIWTIDKIVLSISFNKRGRNNRLFIIKEIQNIRFPNLFDLNLNGNMIQFIETVARLDILNV